MSAIPGLDDEVIARYGESLCMCDRVPDALADALGNLAYIVRFKDRKDIEPFFRYMTE